MGDMGGKLYGSSFSSSPQLGKLQHSISQEIFLPVG